MDDLVQTVQKQTEPAEKREAAKSEIARRATKKQDEKAKAALETLEKFEKDKATGTSTSSGRELILNIAAPGAGEMGVQLTTGAGEMGFYSSQRARARWAHSSQRVQEKHIVQS